MLSRYTLIFTFSPRVIVVTVPALGQLRPPRKLYVGPPLSASKMEGIGGFAQNTIFIRFCISCIFVRFLMSEPDGYESCQPCKAAETFIVVETLHCATQKKLKEKVS